MAEIISILGFIKNDPTAVTLILVIVAVIVVLWLRIKEADVKGITSISTAQNEKLLSLMTQNEKLMMSVSNLQKQIQDMNDKIINEADEHRKKLEQTYKVIDEMRIRITELEDMVRRYQNSQNNCSVIDCKSRIV